MTAQIKKLLLPLLIIIMLIAVNGIMYYSVLSGGEIIQSRDIYGGYYSSDMRSVNNRERLINSLSGDYEKDMESLSAEAEKLIIYKQTADYILNDNYSAIHSLNELAPEERRVIAEQLYSEAKARFPVGEEELIDRINGEVDDYNSVIEYLGYLNGYKAYITNISGQSDFLSDISIYNENSSAMGNIIKTKKDFYGLSNIPLTPVTEDGLISFLNFRPADLLTVLAAVIAAVLPLSKQKKSVAASVILVIFGTAAMYLCNLLITDIFIGLPSPHISVQSMECFKSCPYMINTGVLIAGVILAKTLGAVTIFSAMLIIVTAKGKRRAAYAVIITAFAAFEILFAMAENVPEILKEINLLSCFCPERFFIRYLNLDIFGLTASRLPLFAIFAAGIGAALLILAAKGSAVHNAQLIKEAEQHYYDEINRRYQESRKIRHDIQNHLLALNMLIESGNIDRAKKYINEVSEQTDLAAMPVKTGSEVLDALLFKKTEQAVQKGSAILFEVSCSLVECGISDYDLCTVFGNIIDNAIQAVSDNDTITVTMGNQLDMLYISCENPFSGTLRRRGDRILTTKPNPLSHGYGIARVREIAARYGGDVNISDEDGKFLIEILMNLKK